MALIRRAGRAMKEYSLNVWHDYKTVTVDAAKEGRDKPLKTAAILSGLAGLGYLYKTTPTELEFHDELVARRHKLVLVPNSIHNPEADRALFERTQLLNQGRLHYYNFWFFSLIVKSPHDDKVKAYASQDKSLRLWFPNEFVQNIYDVGVNGKWYKLDQSFVDHDINTNEFPETKNTA
ncbi:unnamed protein product, partial [Mesorhabditis spiculigera]